MVDKLLDCLCIIPARGGSKSIPHKNVSNLAGKPLIVHSIDAASAAKSIGRTIVSTDDPVIAKIAEDAGAEIVQRPDRLSGDEASSESALMHTLETLAKNEGYNPRIVVFLQCTSPLTLPEDIDGTVKLLVDSGADCAFTVTDFHYFLWRRTATLEAEAINHDKSTRLLRQERESQYLETGAVYVMRAKQFRETGHRFFGKSVMYVTPSERCLEIDDPVDLRVAETLVLEQTKI